VPGWFDTVISVAQIISRPNQVTDLPQIDWQPFLDWLGVKMDDRDLPKLRACVVNIMAVLNTMKPGEAEWTVLGDALTEARKELEWAILDLESQEKHSMGIGMN